MPKPVFLIDIVYKLKLKQVAMTILDLHLLYM